MDHHVPVRVTRSLDVPLEDAYRWLTDYEPEDARRAGAVVEGREVVRDPDLASVPADAMPPHDGEVVQLNAATSVLGERGEAVAYVHLHPPERWECHVVEGDGRGSVYEYELAADGPDASTLTVTYNIYVHRWLSRIKVLIARPFIRRELHRMWDGFVDSMEEELAEEGVGKVPAEAGA